MIAKVKIEMLSASGLMDKIDHIHLTKGFP